MYQQGFNRSVYKFFPLKRKILYKECMLKKCQKHPDSPQLAALPYHHLMCVLVSLVWTPMNKNLFHKAVLMLLDG